MEWKSWLVRRRQVEAPVAVEDSEQPVAEPVLLASRGCRGWSNRSRGMYRRTTSPVMASLIAHGAVMILAVSITVVTIERNDAGPTTTTLVLGDKPSKDVGEL